MCNCGLRYLKSISANHIRERMDQVFVCIVELTVHAYSTHKACLYYNDKLHVPIIKLLTKSCYYANTSHYTLFLTLQV